MSNNTICFLCISNFNIGFVGMRELFNDTQLSKICLFSLLKCRPFLMRRREKINEREIFQLKLFMFHLNVLCFTRAVILLQLNCVFDPFELQKGYHDNNFFIRS